jgi:exodeoxyribonuclease-5
MSKANRSLKKEQTLLLKRVKEVFEKYLINDDEHDRLQKMIRSMDEENFTVADTIMKSFISERLMDGLNPGQTVVFKGMLDFINNREHDAAVLKGYAGTGKTFLINRIIEYIMMTEMESYIAVTAPTNKAVNVLYQASKANKNSATPLYFEDVYNSGSRLVYSTIHKLMGIKEVILPSGQQIFKPAKKDDSKLSGFNYLILDEVSMLEDDLCKNIMTYSDNLKIIFLGDPCQIPPVNSVDPIPFREHSDYNFKVFELNHIMRQKDDNPIVDLAYTIRTNLGDKQPIPELVTTLNSKDHGLKYIDSDTDKATIRPLLVKYFKTREYNEDSNYMKVIAWTNETVTYMNTVIREILFGSNLPRFIVGEKLIVQKSIFRRHKDNHNEYWSVVLNSSDELTVKSVNINEVLYQEGTIKERLKSYVLNVVNYDPIENSYHESLINIIHEDDFSKYRRLLDNLKNKAIQLKRAQLWVLYYNVLKWSANVGYNYAITAHKSQGSTYQNVLVIEDDIDNNMKTVERNRIKYTVYTRPTDKLYVVRKNQKVTSPVSR